MHYLSSNLRLHFRLSQPFLALWRQKYGIWDDFQVLARSNSVQMPAIGDKMTLSMREIQHLEDTENPDTQFCGGYWSDSQWLCTEVMKIIDRWNIWAISPHVSLLSLPRKDFTGDYEIRFHDIDNVFLGGGDGDADFFISPTRKSQPSFSSPPPLHNTPCEFSKEC